jgi:hypothetical protein
MVRTLAGALAVVTLLSGCTTVDVDATRPADPFPGGVRNVVVTGSAAAGLAAELQRQSRERGIAVAWSWREGNPDALLTLGDLKPAPETAFLAASWSESASNEGEVKVTGFETRRRYLAPGDQRNPYVFEPAVITETRVRTTTKADRVWRTCEGFFLASTERRVLGSLGYRVTVFYSSYREERDPLWDQEDWTRAQRALAERILDDLGESLPRAAER